MQMLEWQSHSSDMLKLASLGSFGEWVKESRNHQKDSFRTRTPESATKRRALRRCDRPRKCDNCSPPIPSKFNEVLQVALAHADDLLDDDDSTILKSGATHRYFEVCFKDKPPACHHRQLPGDSLFCTLLLLDPFTVYMSCGSICMAVTSSRNGCKCLCNPWELETSGGIRCKPGRLVHDPQ